MRTWVVALLFLSAAGGRAWATVGACSGLADGTPCSEVCIAAGHCDTGVCVSDVQSPDGTPCSSGNHCSLADTCQAGACVPGAAQRSCPAAPDSCHVSACVPAVGCTMTLVCLDGGVPDMVPPQPTPDMSQAPQPTPDMAQAPQPTPDMAQAPQATPDMAQAPPANADMALPPNADMALPPNADMAQAPQRDGGAEEFPIGPVEAGDMAMPPGVTRTLHVHGSSVGGCDMGGGSTDVTLATLLLLLPLALRRRRA